MVARAREPVHAQVGVANARIATPGNPTEPDAASATAPTSAIRNRPLSAIAHPSLSAAAGMGKLHSMAGGVFCIENWGSDLRNRETVRPLLDYLHGRDVARVVHQRVETERELRHYLSRFAGLADYKVGYLALHGHRGHVWVGSRAVTLDTLSRWGKLDTQEPHLDDDADGWDLDLSSKALHLGSCASLRPHPALYRGHGHRGRRLAESRATAARQSIAAWAAVTHAASEWADPWRRAAASPLSWPLVHHSRTLTRDPYWTECAFGKQSGRTP